MKVLRAADFRTMAWKNGGGETTEIIVSPPGASMDDFDWRVSMARVASDGPFSLFSGIDRSLTLLEGAGMTLEIAGMGVHHLTLTSAPLAFPGDVAVKSRLTAGPILDLNVMTRRGVYQAAVERVPGGAMMLDPGPCILLVLIRGGGATVADEAIADGDGVLCSPGEAPILLRCDPTATVYRVAIQSLQG